MSYTAHIISERKNKLYLQRNKIFLIVYVPSVYMEMFACGISQVCNINRNILVAQVMKMKQETKIIILR